MNKLEQEKNEVIIYTAEGDIKVEVIYGSETVWLPLTKIAELFNIDVKTVYKHINNIYNDEELDENSPVANNATMGKTGQKYQTKYYNLDMIISIGFRTNSKKAIKFRTWSNKIIKDYMIQGFALDDDRFMKARKSDQEYFRSLLERKVELI